MGPSGYEMGQFVGAIPFFRKGFCVLRLLLRHGLLVTSKIASNVKGIYNLLSHINLKVYPQPCENTKNDIEKGIGCVYPVLYDKGRG